MAEALTKAGRYQIVGELGRGSMGVVYQGFDPVIGRTVAIKTMLTEGLAGPEFQEYKARFQREAQAAGVLTHPNIVTVYDFGEDNGILYLAMEFLEGKSLEALVEAQHLLPVETIIPIFEQVCGALDHAHRNKIVHRDIKPANIMVLDNGLVKVTDFGIAKMMSMGMTQAGQVLGTPNYMSPEQVKGRAIDGRTDIFSLGVILYELVTGEKPFGGQNITTVIYKIINENPPPPRELDATIHMGLSYVVQKSLAKNADERYQTCRELAEDLRNYRNLGGMPAPSATVVMKVPLPAPAAAVQSAPAPEQAARPMSVQVIPPAGQQQRGTSPAVWILASLLTVAVLGGGLYIYKERSAARTGAEVVPPAMSPSSTPISAPTTEVKPPAVSATTAPALMPNTAPASEPPAPSPAATRTEPTAASKSPTRSAPVPKVGQLIVTSNVEGARISIDGRSEAGWVTPHTFADFPAGGHNVVVSKNGYDDNDRSVTVEGGRTASVSVELSAPRGEINIITVPAGMEISIDGRSQGLSPVRVTVDVGPHQYAIKRPGAQPFESSFEMKSGSIITRKVDLSGGAAAAAAAGTVSVRTIPPGATVYADGAPVGGQSPMSFRLPAGRHTLTISLAGYRAVRREVSVPADGLAPINEVLNRQ